MKLKHILTFLVILTLTIPAASAGFWGDLFNLITGKSIAQEGMSLEYKTNFDLSESGTCSGEEDVYVLKSYGEDLIELPQSGLKTKELYVTLDGCKGLYYKDMATGKLKSLKVVAADLIVLNRYYSLSINSGADISEVFGSGYKSVELAILSSDERTMKLENALSKSKKIYLHNFGTKTNIIYEDLSGQLSQIFSTKQKIEFDKSAVLVPKKTSSTATTAKPVELTDKERLAVLETKMDDLSSKVDNLADQVSALSDNIASPSLPMEEDKSLWNKVFKG